MSHQLAVLALALAAALAAAQTGAPTGGSTSGTTTSAAATTTGAAATTAATAAATTATTTGVAMATTAIIATTAGASTTTAAAAATATTAAAASTTTAAAGSTTGAVSNGTSTTAASPTTAGLSNATTAGSGVGNATTTGFSNATTTGSMTTGTNTTGTTTAGATTAGATTGTTGMVLHSCNYHPASPCQENTSLASGGYSCCDSTSGWPHEWDTDTLGYTSLAVSDDITNTVPLGFSFNWYGDQVSQIRVDSNGWLSFDSGSNTNYGERALPQLGGSPTGLFAWWWDDCRTSTLRYKTIVHPAHGRGVLIEFLGQDYGRNGPIESQMRVFESGLVDVHIRAWVATRSHAMGWENIGGTEGFTYNLGFLRPEMSLPFSFAVYPGNTTTQSPTPTTAAATTGVCRTPDAECSLFDGGNNQRGNAFTVAALQTTVITGMTLHVRGAGDVQVHFRSGRHTGNLASLVGWAELPIINNPAPSAAENFTAYFGQSLTLNPGTYAFAVTHATGLDYTDGSSVFTNDHLIINANGDGVGLGSAMPASTTFSPRMWNGCFVLDAACGITQPPTLPTTLGTGGTGGGGGFVCGNSRECPAGVASASGGYACCDTEGGFPFVWDYERSNTGVLISGRDDETLTLNLGFSFPWYGQSVTSVQVSTNGWISFDPTYQSTTYTGRNMPGSSAQGIFAFHWTDLYMENVYYYPINDNVGQGMAIGFYGYPLGDSVDNEFEAQVRLYSNGLVMAQVHDVPTGSPNYCGWESVGAPNVGYTIRTNEQTPSQPWSLAVYPETLVFQRPLATEYRGDEESAVSTDSGLSGGAIVGIVFGVMVGIMLLAAVAFFIARSSGRSSGSSSTPVVTASYGTTATPAKTQQTPPVVVAAAPPPPAPVVAAPAAAPPPPAAVGMAPPAYDAAVAAPPPAAGPPPPAFVVAAPAPPPAGAQTNPFIVGGGGDVLPPSFNNNYDSGSDSSSSSSSSSSASFSGSASSILGDG